MKDLLRRVERALATENGTGQTDPLARDFLDADDRREIFQEAAGAYTVLRAAVDGALGQLHWINEADVSPTVWSYVQGARGYLDAAVLPKEERR